MVGYRLAGLTVLALALGAVLSEQASAVVPDWPDVFDPTVVHHLNISVMAPTDTTCAGPENATSWDLIQQDTTFTVELPALFWADGETPICVSVRQKSNTPLGPSSDPKVSLKLDINELVGGQRWKLLRKLSLENGDDVNTAAEGLAWQMFRLVADHPSAPPDFTPGLASWVTLAVNGTEYGLYVNAEQRDKSFLQNRSLHTPLLSWLYRWGDEFDAIVPTSSDPNAGTDSMTHTTLCYLPFAPATCATPASPAFENELNALVDMDVLLTYGALATFVVMPDQMLAKDKNHYYGDWDTPIIRKRRYFPWDLDEAFKLHCEFPEACVDVGIDCNFRMDSCIQGNFQNFLLGTSTTPGPFRAQFEATMCGLLDGAFQPSALASLVTDVENLISADLIAFPLSANIISGPILTVPQYFNELRQYMVDRTAVVESQITCAEPHVIPVLDLRGRTAFGLLMILAAGFALRRRR